MPPRDDTTDGLLRVPSLAELDRLLAQERTLVFKHSLLCPTSARALSQARAFADAFPTVPLYRIDVQTERGLSDRVEEITDVIHQSPQVVLVDAGRVMGHLSHGEIRVATLARLWEKRG